MPDGNELYASAWIGRAGGVGGWLAGAPVAAKLLNNELKIRSKKSFSRVVIRSGR